MILWDLTRDIDQRYYTVVLKRLIHFKFVLIKIIVVNTLFDIIVKDRNIQVASFQVYSKA